MGADHHQQTIVADPLQPQLTLHQPGDHAALHIKGVSRHLNDVRCVHHVGMGDQRVADRGQQGGHRHGIPGVTADLRSHPGGNQQDRVELLGVLHRSPVQPEYGRRRPVALQPVQQPNFAVMALLIRIWDPHLARNRQPDRYLVRLQLTHHGFAQLPPQVRFRPGGGENQLAFVQFSGRHAVAHAPHRAAKSSYV